MIVYFLSAHTDVRATAESEANACCVPPLYTVSPFFHPTNTFSSFAATSFGKVTFFPASTFVEATNFEGSFNVSAFVKLIVTSFAFHAAVKVTSAAVSLGIEYAFFPVSAFCPLISTFQPSNVYPALVGSAITFAAESGPSNVSDFVSTFL